MQQGINKWYYCVCDGAKTSEAKGPLFASSLLRLLETGVLKAEETMVCNASEWRWLVEEPTLRDKVALVRNIWYYADGEETKGPINLSELRRRFEAGDLDGLTRVYWREEWSAIAEIPGLRELLIMAGSLQSLEQNQMLQDDDSDTSLRPPDELPVSTECKNQDEDDGSETERKQKKKQKT